MTKFQFTTNPALFFFVGVLLFSVFRAEANLKNEVAFYVDTFGELTAQQDPRVAEAQRIFKKVHSVADRNSKYLAKLVIINNNSQAIALALPAGHIVLSKQVLDIVHRSANTEVAEARLAFILGHELAHLANDDFWQHEVGRFMQNPSGIPAVPQPVSQSAEKIQAELAADDKGYIYAAMAGYSVNRLLGKQQSKTAGAKGSSQDFFTFWMQQTNTKNSVTHPQAKDRSELLHQRLYQVEQKLAFFRIGTRLAHFGQCEIAIHFFKEFQKVFPGRSVLNNLGLCFLQQARSQMQQQRLAFYWFPLMLDTQSRADIKTREISKAPTAQHFLKNFNDENSTLNGYLDDAVNVLSLATQQDPLYMPAKINLAIAYLYQGKPHQARAVLTKIKQQKTINIQIEMLNALALYEQSDADIDLWETAVKKLKRLTKNKQSNGSRYNYARLMSIRSKTIAAQNYWNQLLKKANDLPPANRKELCAMQNLIPAVHCLQKMSKKHTQPNWSWLFTKTSRKLNSTDREKLQKHWKSVTFDWVSASLHGYIHQNNAEEIEILEMNYSIPIQVLKGNPVADIDKIETYCKYPFIKRKLDNTEIWTCDNWAVLIDQHQPKEIWYFQQ